MTYRIIFTVFRIIPQTEFSGLMRIERPNKTEDYGKGSVSFEAANDSNARKKSSAVLKEEQERRSTQGNGRYELSMQKVERILQVEKTVRIS